jgi:hypothetical protein
MIIIVFCGEKSEKWSLKKQKRAKKKNAHKNIISQHANV